MKIDMWQGEREKAEVLPCGLKVLKTDTPRGPSLMVWMPKAIRPFINYLYRNAAGRDAKLAEVIENYGHAQKIKQDRKAERKATPEKMAQVSVGSIFHFSWGYDQTNNDFYQVIEVHGAHVVLRELRQESRPAVGCSPMSDYRLPVKDSFTSKAPFTKLVQFSQGKPFIKMASYGWCDLWDGKEAYNSWYA